MKFNVYTPTGPCVMSGGHFGTPEEAVRECQWMYPDVMLIASPFPIVSVMEEDEFSRDSRRRAAADAARDFDERNSW